MKLRSLKIEDYGLFSNRTLAFETTGVQLVYGANGTGKTTLLSLLRELLFGMQLRYHPYDYRERKDLAVEAVMELASGQRIQFRRRKGRKGVVVGRNVDTRQPIDESAFIQLLDAASAPLYNNLFAFAQDELIRGTDSLQAARPNEALFGMGLSRLTTFRALQHAIDTEQSELFSPSKNARNPQINALLKQIQQKDAELQEATVSPAQYSERQSVIDELTLDVQRLRAEETKWQQERQRLARRAEALPLMQELTQLRQTLGKFDEATRRITCQQIDEYERLTSRRDQLTSQIAKLETQNQRGVELQSLTSEERGVLSLMGPVRALNQQCVAVRHQMQELATRCRQRSVVTDELQDLRGQLKLPSDDQPIPLPPTEEIDRTAGELARRLEHLSAEQERLRTGERAERNRITVLDQRRDDLAESPDALAIEPLNRHANRYRRDCADLEAARQRREVLDVERHELTVTLSERQIAADVPLDPKMLPDLAAVEQLEAAWQQTLTELERLNEVIDDLQSQVDESGNDSRDEGERPHELTMLAALRQRRDTGWQLIHRRFVVGDTSQDLLEDIDRWTDNDPEALVAIYEAVVVESDRAADKAHSVAHDSARRRERAAQLQKLKSRIAGHQNERTVATDLQESLREQSQQLWADSGMGHGSPVEMAEWLRTHALFTATVHQRAIIDRQIDELTERIQTFESRAAGVLKNVHFAEADRRGEPLATALEQCYSAALKSAAEQAQLERDKDQIDKLLQTYEEQRQKLDAQQAQALIDLNQLLAEWSIPGLHHLRQAGLGATQVVRLLATLSQRQEQAADFDRQIAEIQRDVTNWNQQVEAICIGIPVDTVEQPPDKAIDAALEFLTQLEQRQRDATAQCEARVETQELRTGWQQELAEVQQLLTPLCEALALNEDVDADERLQEIRTALDLSEHQERIASHLNAVCGNSWRDPDWQIDDAAAIADELHSVEVRLGQVQHSVQRHTEKLGVARNDLDQLAAEDGTSKIAAERQGLLAELANAMDRWAPRMLAQRLMQRALKRFETDHQPYVLEQGGRLLSRMTAGEYVAIRRRLTHDASEAIVIETSKGDRLVPAALSRGTQQQLFLSLRLALVEEYCHRNEPLPIVLDDVLGDFDDVRMWKTLQLLCEYSQRHQVIFLTCHDQVVQMFNELQPDSRPIELVPGTLPQRLSPAEVGPDSGPVGVTMGASTPRRRKRRKTERDDDSTQQRLFS